MTGLTGKHEREAVRARVHRLLRDGTRYKVLRYCTEEARATFEEAWRLSQSLGEPWCSVTAYRLAHLLMREARDVATLRRAAELFDQAAQGRIGPWPALHRVAVLSRLDASREVLLEAFETARTAVRALDPRGMEAPPSATQARLQTPTFNALEMAAWFIGAPYELLDGQARLMASWEDLFPESSSWMLVSADPRTADVRYPKELALAELETLGDESGALLFSVEICSGERLLERWRPAGEDWREAPRGHCRLLAAMMRPAEDGRDGHAQLTRDLGDEAYRQLKRRLGVELVAMGAAAEGAVYLERGRGVLPALRPDVRVLGAVDTRAR